jgi:hypothetical protein
VSNYAPKPNVQSGGLPIAGQRLATSGTAVSFGSFNATTNLVIVDVQVADMYVTFDGTTPSSTNGAQLYAGNSYSWAVTTAQNAKFLQQVSAGTVQSYEFIAPLNADVQMPVTDVLKPKNPMGGVGAFSTITVSGAANFGGGIFLTGTAPNVAGSITLNTGTGLTLQGKTGAVYDFSIINAAGTQFVMELPTGGSTPAFPNGFSVTGGTAAAGTVTLNGTDGLLTWVPSGSTYDYAILNHADTAFIMTVATGTAIATFPSGVAVGSSLNFSNTANSYQGVVATNAQSGTAAQIAFQLTNNSHNCFLGLTSTAFSGAPLTGGSTGEVFYMDSGAAIPLNFAVNGTVACIMDTNGFTHFSTATFLKSYTVGTLPAASSTTGSIAAVSDSTTAGAAGVGAAPTGGGGNTRIVYSTGAAWIQM